MCRNAINRQFELDRIEAKSLSTDFYPNWINIYTNVELVFFAAISLNEVAQHIKYVNSLLHTIKVAGSFNFPFILEIKN